MLVVLNKLDISVPLMGLTVGVFEEMSLGLFASFWWGGRVSVVTEVKIVKLRVKSEEIILHCCGWMDGEAAREIMYRRNYRVL